MMHLCNKTLAIQRKSAGTDDGMGGTTGGDFATVATTPAFIEPASAETRLRFQQYGTPVTHEIYTPMADIRVGDRLALGARRFYVVAPLNPGEMDHHLEMVAEERKA